jgi:hypothetical protein
MMSWRGVSAALWHKHISRMRSRWTSDELLFTGAFKSASASRLSLRVQPEVILSYDRCGELLTSSPRRCRSQPGQGCPIV